MVSINAMSAKLPALETAGLTFLFVLNGSGGAGISLQSIANIVARVTGPFSFNGFSSSQPQTVLGTAGWFNQLGGMAPKIGALVIAIVGKVIYKDVVPGFPYKGKITSYIVNPILNSIIAASFINIILGDPSGYTGGAVGPSVARINTRVPYMGQRSVAFGAY
jgi:hypothetical protein